MSFFVFSQTNVKFNFVPRDKNFKDTLYVTKFDKKYSFSSDRTFYADGSFSDSKLFCIKDTSICSLYFKIDSDNNWYLKSSDKWFLLFDNKTKKICKIVDQKGDLLLKPTTNQELQGNHIFAFTTETIKTKTVCGEGSYWFSPKEGIIAVGTNSLLVRKDFSETLK